MNPPLTSVREFPEELGKHLAEFVVRRGHVRYGLEETVSKMQTQAPLEWRLSRAVTVVEGG